MPRHTRLAWLLLVILPAWTARGQEAIPEGTLARLKAATVYIRVPRGPNLAMGSGFLIEKSAAGGFVATNAHVVQDSSGRAARHVECVFHSGTKQEFRVAARIVAADSDRDLAVLAVPAGKLPDPLDVKVKRNVRETLPVFIVGFPFGEGLATGRRNPAATIASARISSIRRDDLGRVALLQVDGGINPGNSGGPMVDSSGTLLGIAVAKLRGTEIGFAIPNEELAEVLLGRVAGVVTKAVRMVGGRVEFDVAVGLVDPKDRIQKVSIEAVARSRVRKIPAPPRDGKFRPVSTQMRSFPMKTSHGLASGRMYLEADEGKPVAYLFQVKYTRGDGRTSYTQAAVVQADPTLHSLAGGPKPKPKVPAPSPRPKTPRPRPRDPRPEAPNPRPEPPKPQPRTPSIGRVLPRTGRPRLRSAGLEPVQIKGESLEIALGAAFDDLEVGGGGRYFVFHASKRGEVAIVDLNQRKVVKKLELPVDARIAAGLDKLVVALPFQGKLERWSLATLEKERTVRAPFQGMVKTLCLGNASTGPLLVHWAKGTGSMQGAYFSLLDLDSFRPYTLQSLTAMGANGPRAVSVAPSGEFGLRNGGGGTSVTHLRASATGHVFGCWCTHQSPTGLETLILDPPSAVDNYKHDSVGHVVPTADGAAICTGEGYYASDLGQNRGKDWCLPTYHPRYYLVASGLPAQRPKKSSSPVKVSIFDAEAGRPVHDFTVAMDWAKLGTRRSDVSFPPDKRLHCIPHARCTITVPHSGDRLVVRKLDFEFAPLALEEAVEEAAADRASDAKQPRTWTDKSGSYRVVASFVALIGNKVKLRRDNGSEILVPLDKLSDEDVKYVNSLRK